MNKTVVQFRSSPTGVPRGTQLNDTFEIEDQIAAGGMGEIYRGHLIETGDPVAIKMIKPELADNEAVLALFRKEASALNELHHDSIVRYYVFALDKRINRRFLAMEFVEGRALSDILRNRPLALAEVNELRKRVGAGLQVAHDKGIIHRDISPDNIILPKEDVKLAKIIDFGIARSTKMGSATVIGDGFAGKYNYVSPEQLGLFGGNVTNRSDIYSFGLVLAEALLGKAIDMSGSQADVIDKRRVVPDLSQIDARIRPLITKMLQPKPEDRPASMTEVAEWDVTSTKLDKGKPGQGGSKAPVAAVAGVVALLAAGGGGWFLMKGSPAPEPARPQAIAIVPPPPVPVTPPLPVAPPSPPPVTQPVEPPRTRTGPLTTAERAERVLNYIRYYDGGSCMFLSPVQVGDRAATIEALASTTAAIQLFEDDFRTVNGFAAKVTPARLTQQQCEIVPYLHRIDPAPEAGLAVDVRQRAVKPGDKVLATIGGTGDRLVDAVVINEDGTVRVATQLLKKERGATVLDARIDDQDRAQPRQKLLVTIVSPRKIAALSGGAATGASAFFSALADEVERSGIQITVAPRLIRYE